MSLGCDAAIILPHSALARLSVLRYHTVVSLLVGGACVKVLVIMPRSSSLMTANRGGEAGFMMQARM